MRDGYSPVLTLLFGEPLEENRSERALPAGRRPARAPVPLAGQQLRERAMIIGRLNDVNDARSQRIGEQRLPERGLQ